MKPRHWEPEAIRQVDRSSPEALTHAVKEAAHALGAHLVGITSLDRLEGAPADLHPRRLLPEAQSVIAQARRDATAAGEQLISDAHEDANRERQRALADIETAKNAAVQEIADQSAKLAFTLARKLIHKELKPEDHTALIRESLEQFPSEN